MVSLALNLVALTLIGGASAFVHWSYHDHHTHHGTLDPVEWPQHFEACGGQKQSPIDIVPKSATKVSTLTPLKITKAPADQQLAIINNGHSVQVDYSSPPPAMNTSMGAYVLAQYHFHWGHGDGVGSEHTVDGRHFPMEMHMVHYRQGLGSVGNAKDVDDGLLVIGFFFEISASDNTALNPIIHAFNGVKEPGRGYLETFDNIDIVGKSLSGYFRYSGSLTTPPCSESVVWNIAQDALKVSEKQIQHFRDLDTESGGHIIDNFRPTQPLNGRIVTSS